MARNRKEFREESTEEKVLTVDEALNIDRASVLYENLSEITKSHGMDLLLKIRLIHSDYRTAGFLDDVTSTDEVQGFIDNPEGFLKSHYGEGSFRVDVIDALSKKYVTHLKMDISSPREKINRQPSTPQINLDDVSRARKEARGEILELISLVKTSQPTPNNQPSLDPTKLLELVMIQNEKTKEREEKVLERIRADENRLREKELELLQQAYKNSTDLTAHLKPLLDSMSIYGKVFSNSLNMVEKIIAFRDTFSSETTAPEQRGFIERILISIGERLLEGNPQILEKLSSTLTQTNTPTPVTTHIPIGNNQPNRIEENTPLIINKSPSNPTLGAKESNSHAKPEPQLTPEQNFFTSLLQLIDKWNTLEDPEAFAYEVDSNLEYLSTKEILSITQIKAIEEFLVSENFLAHIEATAPKLAPQTFLIQFQNEYKKILNETETDESNTVNRQ